jgi:excisionase family DNA binding protein
MNQYLNVKEVAELLHIAEKTVRKYVWQKSIPYTKIGGHVRFNKERLNQWLEYRNVPTLDEIQFGSIRNSSLNRKGVDR